MATMKEVSFRNWRLVRTEDRKTKVYKNGKLCEKIAPALREMAMDMGMNIDPTWRTSQLRINIFKSLSKSPKITIKPIDSTKVIPGTTYRDLLTTHCVTIVEKVLADMQEYKLDAEGKIPIPKVPILYRWWFPENSIVMQVLRDFSHSDNDLATLLGKVETRRKDDKTYYALYFGKSNKGYRRFIQHSAGNVHTSTLRCIIYGLCIGDKYDKANEPRITEILDECYCDWIPFEQEGNLIECVESICIALGYYPLNVEGNPSISENWRDKLMNLRKID